MTEMMRKSVSFDFKMESDDSGIFEGYASVFGDIDQGDDVVERGAYAKSLASGRKVRMLWQHDTRNVIGVWDEIKEDERGLFVRGRILSDVQKGREALALLKAGAIDSMSIGYRAVETAMDNHVRKLLEVELYEISLVTFPMLESATVTDVKSIGTEREFEAFLRDAGFSRSEATAVALHGFKGIKGQRDAVIDDVDAGAKATIETIRQLQETLKCLTKSK